MRHFLILALVLVLAMGVAGPVFGHAPDCKPAPRSAPATQDSATILLAVDGMM